MRQRRFALAPAIAMTVLGLAAAPAFADSPHFVTAGATGPAADGTLATTFKIAGLGDTVTTTVTAAADATAGYACRNNGGNFPEDPKKEEVTGPVTASGEFTSGRNGNVNGTLVLSPPASTLDCPPGQHEVLLSVAYTGVRVSEPAAEVTSISGVFSRTLLTP